MFLSSIDLYRYAIRFKEPVRLEDVTLNRREGALIRLTANDGTTAWGEAAPLPGFSPEGLDETIDQLRALSSRLVGRKVPTGDPIADISPLAAGMELTHSVRFGLETAFLSLEAAHRRTPLSALLTGNPRETVSINGLISGSVDGALSEARAMKGRGYRSVKLKVGTQDVAEEAAVVRRVAGVLGNGVSLRLDANRAWGFDEAVEFGRCVSGVQIEYVEEPLVEATRLPELARLWGLPVALDESLVGMAPEELEEHTHAGAVVLKPTLLGGISRSLRFAGRAKDLGMVPVVSAAYECGVGTGALVALAAAISGGPVGLDTYRRFAEDVLQVPLPLPAPEVDARETVEAAGKVALEALEPI